MKRDIVYWLQPILSNNTTLEKFSHTVVAQYYPDEELAAQKVPSYHLHLTLINANCFFSVGLLQHCTADAKLRNIFMYFL